MEDKCGGESFVERVEVIVEAAVGRYRMRD